MKLTEKRLAIIVSALLLGSILFVGLMNGHDIQECQARGNSLETCYSVFKP